MQETYTLFLLHAGTLKRDSRKHAFFKALLETQRKAGVKEGVILGTGLDAYDLEKEYFPNKIKGFEVLPVASSFSFKRIISSFLGDSFKEKLVNFLFRTELSIIRDLIKTNGYPKRVVALSGNSENALLVWILQKRFHLRCVFIEHRSNYSRELFRNISLKKYLSRSISHFGLVVKRFLRNKSINTYQFRQLSRLLANDWDILRSILNNTNKIVVVSSNLAEKMLNLYRKKEHRKLETDYQVIPNPILLSSIEPDRDLTELLDNFKGNRIMFAGWQNWVRSIKRPEMIVKAFLLAKEEKPEICLAMGGPVSEKLKEFVNLQSSDKSILLLGSLKAPEVAALAEECNCHLVGSDSETFSLPVVEAMSFGKPTISTRCGGPEILLDKSFLGELVEKNDIAAFAEALINFVKQKYLYPSNKIKNYWKKKYSIDAISKKWSSLYKEI